MIRPLLLHLANSSPPGIYRQEFYALKQRLLEKHGEPDGYDTQEIVKECWGHWSATEYGVHIGCSRSPSCRCGGTGIFSRRIIGLERWCWGRFNFHRPIDRIPNALITIRGRIQHRKYGRVSNEATLWLYLLCGEFRLLARHMSATCSLGAYCFPMLLLNRAWFWVAHHINRRECIYCRKRFFTLGTGWCVCWKCQKMGKTGAEPIDEPIPF